MAAPSLMRTEHGHCANHGAAAACRRSMAGVGVSVSQWRPCCAATSLAPPVLFVREMSHELRLGFQGTSIDPILECQRQRRMRLYHLGLARGLSQLQAA